MQMDVHQIAAMSDTSPSAKALPWWWSPARQGTNSPCSGLFRHGTDWNFTPKLERYRIIEPYPHRCGLNGQTPKSGSKRSLQFLLKGLATTMSPMHSFHGIYMGLQYLARLESASSFQSYFVARPQSIGAKCCTPMQITGVKIQRFWPVHEHQVFGVD